MAREAGEDMQEPQSIQARLRDASTLPDRPSAGPSGLGAASGRRR